ncbi:PRTRC system protein E [Cupriavidus oxalaticus]|uniref:PRTRC system protein E n=1 Tax=Cupriavidus oxalaticus TaxID=96344 RepID=A0A4P7LJP6_9BURK|nr:PRTRC system protein E [Cupriavidus oxalaticus]QBY56380.1 PRTRC system protein E [Cupriavidus oxalaticus]
MFTELVPLVRASDKVVVTLSMQGDVMSVVVLPVIKNAADAALTSPLVLSATPAELDAEFAAAVLSVSESHRSLAEQAEATKSILDAAKSTQSSKATKALAKAASPSASEASSGSDDDSEAGDAEAGDAAQTEADAKVSTPSSVGTDLASLL